MRRPGPAARGRPCTAAGAAPRRGATPEGLGADDLAPTSGWPSPLLLWGLTNGFKFATSPNRPAPTTTAPTYPVGG
eukprot:4116932-Pyramimonas_sp.AAC.1